MLCGLDTEYGLLIEGRGADTQIEDCAVLVRAYPGACFVGWDNRYESPRQDLRGFQLSHLAEDPTDARFGGPAAPLQEVRSDRILPNGARFYNDHGHPEYATPECWSIHEAADHDAAGATVVMRAAESLSQRLDCAIRLFKNNTDFHGASWGTHESYLAPRALGFDKLFAALAPLLVVRPVLVGAGKVGAEHGKACIYQLSQRADFIVEPANAETLYRRPLFNTRDEPHGARADWIRVHVISGDSNMMRNATALKLGLVKLAIRLAAAGAAPIWNLKDPVEAAKSISRDETYKFELELQRRSWTTAYEIFESYFAAAESTLQLDGDERWTIDAGRSLLRDLQYDWHVFRKRVDWAAKRFALEMVMTAESLDWREQSLRAYDMEYHNLDTEQGLYYALVAMGEVEAETSDPFDRLAEVREGTRARARSIAVRKFGTSLTTACWRSLTFSGEEVDLNPAGEYPPELEDTESVEEFIQALRSIE